MSIEVKDLRIGNLVYSSVYGKEIHIVFPAQIDNIWDGIPLTEELLVDKFGFHNTESNFFNTFYKIVKVTYAKSEIVSLSRNSDKYGLWYLSFRQGDETEFAKMHKNELVFLSNKLKYVHELQNWYYVLTGLELEIKTEACQ